MSDIDPEKLSEEGKRAFGEKNFEKAADLFRQAAQGFALTHAEVAAAEARNNLSVALLQAGKAQQALEAAQGTDNVFGAANDIKRQAMAFGNQAAALEALNRADEAIAMYERSADLFGQAGEGELRAIVLKSSAGVKLKKGRITESAYRMIGAVEASDKPTIFERIMRFLLRFIQK